MATNRASLSDSYVTTPRAAVRQPMRTGAPSLQAWEATVMILLGGIGFAAGAALVGIGMGRWTSPRPPENDADYTGPGDDAGDMPQPPRVV